MSDEATTTNDQTVKLIEINVEALVKETVKGIASHLPAMIEQQLEARGILSVAAPEDYVDMDANANNSIQGDSGSPVLSKQRGSSALDNTKRDAGALNDEGDASARRNLSDGENIEGQKDDFDRVSY